MAETTKPRQMIRRATFPASTVSGVEVKSRMRGSEATRQPRVPAAMMGGAQDEGDLVEPAYPFVLPGTVVVADEGTHSLHDAVGGQVEECL